MNEMSFSYRWISVESLFGNECVVKIRDYDVIIIYPSSIKYKKIGLRLIVCIIYRDHLFKVNLGKGETAFIYSEELVPSFIIESQPENPVTSHSWGLH